MPPLQAGMLPSALPAFSAPSGVSCSPSCAASCGVTAPQERGASSTPAAAIRSSVLIRPPRISGMHDLQDAVAQLLTQDELCVLRHLGQNLVELEFAAVGGTDDAALAQLEDEVLKHGAVEEFR